MASALPISLGLDLAGGSHLLIEADMQDALKQRLQAKEDEVPSELRRDPTSTSAISRPPAARLSFMVRNPTQVDAAVERMRQLSQPVKLTGSRDWDVQVVDSDPDRADPDAGRHRPGAQRRDGRRAGCRPPPHRSGGTKEITVVTEGGNRILVEVPGVEDPEALKRLIGQTARLEFKLVDLTANPEDAQQGRAPPGSQVLPMADGSGVLAGQAPRDGRR